MTEEMERKETEALARARDKVRALGERLKRTPTACVVNFGCQVNTERETKKSRRNSGFFVFMDPARYSSAGAAGAGS